LKSLNKPLQSEFIKLKEGIKLGKKINTAHFIKAGYFVIEITTLLVLAI